MSLTVRDRKILWSRAGNRCAFPGCRQELVEKNEDGGSDVIVGEEAHIIPRSRNGPRSCNWNREDNLDSYDNRIILCPKHHKFVDGSPEIYTKQCMIDMKSSHEWRVAASRRSAEELSSVGITQFGVIGQAVQLWNVGDSRVVVNSYGSPPIPLPCGHWRASGVRIGQLLGTGDVHWLFDSSEADPDIEYWPTDSSFNIVQTVYLYDENRSAPFIKHEFDFTTAPVASKVELLLEADSESTAGIPDLLKEIWSIDHYDYGGGLEFLLLRLWRAGLSDPERVLEEFRGFKSAKWYDGAVAELVMSLTSELRLVQRARANHQGTHRQLGPTQSYEPA